MRSNSILRTPKEIALAFVHAFCAGDLEAIARLLAAGLEFDGPWLRTRSRAAYLRRLRRDPPLPGARYRLLSSVEHGDEACLVYRYEKSDGTLRIAQWVRCRDGEIVEMRLLFEPAASRPSRRRRLDRR